MATNDKESAMFTMENTEGYSQEQLDELNRRVDACLDGDVNFNEDELKNLHESIQRDFDTENS